MDWQSEIFVGRVFRGRLSYCRKYFLNNRKRSGFPSDQSYKMQLN